MAISTILRDPIVTTDVLSTFSRNRKIPPLLSGNPRISPALISIANLLSVPRQFNRDPEQVMTTELEDDASLNCLTNINYQGANNNFLKRNNVKSKIYAVCKSSEFHRR
ncbi:hypothetical protein DAKH74_034280 [Maudiozyma humilis]|uniref:Uncharacterized protein n=1 Tax=Maudiozyma humilis TaxID=51915 RepID=A0AAV5S1I0_MAUHU|nr:hypothetical protein DAKH74_034280 [Kazachstania humilis]